jgi:hypothetical protein
MLTSPCPWELATVHITSTVRPITLDRFAMYGFLAITHGVTIIVFGSTATTLRANAKIDQGAGARRLILDTGAASCGFKIEQANGTH